MSKIITKETFEAQTKAWGCILNQDLKKCFRTSDDKYLHSFKLEGDPLNQLKKLNFDELRFYMAYDSGKKQFLPLLKTMGSPPSQYFSMGVHDTSFINKR
ncbi:MAG: hypothetical protein AAGM67_14780, partial [Bacteroidota bacterium]